MVNESQTEDGIIGELAKLKYAYRSDIRDRNAWERNSQEQFEAPAEQAAIAAKPGLATEALTTFVDGIMGRMVFDNEGLGWKVRAAKESELMADPIPLLKDIAQGREISGLEAHE